jgi:hypothetical protein
MPNRLLILPSNQNPSCCLYTSAYLRLLLLHASLGVADDIGQQPNTMPTQFLIKHNPGAYRRLLLLHASLGVADDIGQQPTCLLNPVKKPNP